jgi:hypothetical protein
MAQESDYPIVDVIRIAGRLPDYVREYAARCSMSDCRKLVRSVSEIYVSEKTDQDTLVWMLQQLGIRGTSRIYHGMSSELAKMLNENNTALLLQGRLEACMEGHKRPNYLVELPVCELHGLTMNRLKWDFVSMGQEKYIDYGVLDMVAQDAHRLNKQ